MSTAALPEILVGTELPARSFLVDRQRLVDYANAGGDQNPIHQDEEFARKVGLPDVIAHGMWTMGTAIQAVTDWIGDPARVISYSTRFTSPVVVPAQEGNAIEVSGSVTKLDEEAGTATVALKVTADGVSVLGRATAVVRIG